MDKQWIPTVAGVLEIVAAVCGVIGSLVLAFICLVVSTVPEIQNDPNVPIGLINSLFGTLSVLVFLGAMVCLIGGIAAIRRRGWAWAVAGAIAALFLMTPAGVFALVLVIVGEKEFGGRVVMDTP